MIKPLRCRCGLVVQRRRLLQAIESGCDFVCPDPACARLMTVAQIERFLQNIGEITYDAPTQPPPPEAP